MKRSFALLCVLFVGFVSAHDCYANLPCQQCAAKDYCTYCVTSSWSSGGFCTWYGCGPSSQPINNVNNCPAPPAPTTPTTPDPPSPGVPQATNAVGLVIILAAVFGSLGLVLCIVLIVVCVLCARRGRVQHDYVVMSQQPTPYMYPSPQQQQHHPTTIFHSQPFVSQQPQLGPAQTHPQNTASPFFPSAVAVAPPTAPAPIVPLAQQ